MAISWMVASLNRPEIKAAVKNGIGYFSFTGSFYVIHSEWKSAHSEKNWDDCLRIALQTSIVFTALVTVPGQKICGWVAHQMMTPAALEKVFGRNVTFAENPFHLRHLVSISANVLSALVFVDIFQSRHQGKGTSLALRSLALFNFFTGRPMLHGVNALFRG